MIGSLNVLALAVNEQDRFDDSTQDFVLRLYNCFGTDLFSMLCIVFTRAFGLVSTEKARKNTEDIRKLI